MIHPAIKSPTGSRPSSLSDIKRDACSICSKTVYPMDKITADDKMFHKTCLRCGHCNKVLSLGNYAALSGTFYCKPHFKQLFALKGNYSDGFKASQAASNTQAQSNSDHSLATSPRRSKENLTELSKFGSMSLHQPGGATASNRGSKDALSSTGSKSNLVTTATSPVKKDVKEVSTSPTTKKTDRSPTTTTTTAPTHQVKRNDTSTSMETVPKMDRGTGRSLSTMQIEKGTSVENVTCTETGTDAAHLSHSNAATSIDNVDCVDGVDELKALIDSQNDEIIELKRQLVLKDAEIERLSVVAQNV